MVSAEYRLAGMGQALIAIVVVDGRVVGTWKRTLKKDAVQVKLDLFTRPSPEARRAIANATTRYGEFIGLPAVMG